MTQLLNKGVDFNSEEPSYFCTKLSDLKLALISMAAEDGRKRAEAIAAKSGAHLSPPFSLKYEISRGFPGKFHSMYPFFCRFHRRR